MWVNEAKYEYKNQTGINNDDLIPPGTAGRDVVMPTICVSIRPIQFRGHFVGNITH